MSAPPAKVRARARGLWETLPATPVLRDIAPTRPARSRAVPRPSRRPLRGPSGLAGGRGSGVGAYGNPVDPGDGDDCVCHAPPIDVRSIDEPAAASPTSTEPQEPDSSSRQLVFELP